MRNKEEELWGEREQGSIPTLLKRTTLYKDLLLLFTLRSRSSWSLYFWWAMLVGSATTASFVILFLVRLLKERLVINSEFARESIGVWEEVREPTSDVIKRKRSEGVSLRKSWRRSFLMRKACYAIHRNSFYDIIQWWVLHSCTQLLDPLDWALPISF